MRAAIRQKLINQIPGIGERCYEPHAAGAKTQKPYLVLRQGVDTEDTAWTGYRRIVEVWPYVSRTTFQDVDSLANRIISALGDQPLTTAAGEVFTCQYLGVIGADQVDEDWGAITRGLRFAVLALQPVAVPETIEPDPWTEALAAWTEEALGEDWTIYRNVWPLGYIRPAVMWRLAGIEIIDQDRAVYEVRKRFVGHVLGGTPNQQISGALTIAQGLGQDIKIPLDVDNRRYLTARRSVVNLQAAALTAGQISVTLSRRTTRPADEVPLMMHVEGRGNLM